MQCGPSCSLQVTNTHDLGYSEQVRLEFVGPVYCLHIQVVRSWTLNHFKLRWFKENVIKIENQSTAFLFKNHLLGLGEGLSTPIIMKISERDCHFIASINMGQAKGHLNCWSQTISIKISPSNPNKGKVGILKGEEANFWVYLSIYTKLASSAHNIPQQMYAPLAIAVGVPQGLFFPAVNFLFHKEETFLYFYRF